MALPVPFVDRLGSSEEPRVLRRVHLNQVDDRQDAAGSQQGGRTIKLGRR